MKRPITILPQFIKGKIPLYYETCIIETSCLIDIKGSDPRYQKRLVESSEEVTKSSYNHFFNDNIDLTKIRDAILSGNYSIQDNAKKLISKRLNIMQMEILSFFNFEQKARRIPKESIYLDELSDNTKILIESPLQNNINILSELI